MQNDKIVIYQVFTRLFGNDHAALVNNGSLKENGCGKMADFTQKALHEIKQLGATHIWYTGLLEHATQTDYSSFGIKKDHPAVVKGMAGSPYAVKDYYDIDPDLAKDVPGRMKEMENLVSRTHRAGLKFLMDFVPNHVARQYHADQQPEGTRQLGEDDDQTKAFSPQNNFYYIPQTDFHGQFDLFAGQEKPYNEMPARATGNDCFHAYPNINDWYETVKLNYGVDYQGGGSQHFSPTPDTWKKMLDILLFWSSRKIDGFRCDMAEMVPVAFWEWAIPQVKAAYPHIIFIAEVYNPAQYRDYLFRGHFDYLYDKVGLYDTLRNIICGGASAEQLTATWKSVDDIQTHMLHFLENHDEQRIASNFFATDARKALPALVVSATMNTAPMMIYFGQELGEMGMDNEGFSGRDGRTTIFDYWSVDSIRRWRNGGTFDGSLLTDEEKELRAYYQHVLNLCHTEAAIRQGQFFDLMYVNARTWHFNEHSLYAYLRKYKEELLICVANFSEQGQHCELSIPQHAFDFLQLPTMDKVVATDLLTDQQQEVTLQPSSMISLSLQGYQSVMLKIILKNK